MTVEGSTRSAHADTFTREALPPREQWPELLFDLPELHYPDQLNCAVELLDRTIERHGADRPCFHGADGATWSYADVRDRANRVAHVLSGDLGLVPGGRVLLRGPNNPWLAVCWLAVLKAGGVVVTTMPLLRSGELQVVCDIARVDLALCDARFLDDLVGAGIDGLRITPYGGAGPDDLLTRIEGKPASYDDVGTAADDVALLAFTSGTTGKPKATMHVHRDVLAIADTFSAHVVKPEPSDVFAGSPPLAFTFGLGGLVVFPLRAGASSLLLEKAPPEELFAAVARHRVSVLFTAPTGYRAALRHISDFDLSSLRRCISAGEPLPLATWQAFHDATGLRIIDGIGATEMLHVFISAADDDIRPGATGRAVPGYRACVLDDDGNPAPDGEPGRLAVKGPTGCRYLADDRQSVYVQGGWNITGDTYIRDVDGYFWYQARSDDMIISAGYNIAGPEVENALLRHHAVEECAVVGLPDEDRGMVVTAYVVVGADVPRTPETARTLQEFVKAQIAPYKYPRVVHFVDALPKTATGKLQRFALRQQQAG
ncbi:MAG: 2-aminobenzoate-CoA ligase [Actinomycetota bacterium]|nr:2-aminobenzoate-CoA ligase [Actinomycetota bacterium]